MTDPDAVVIGAGPNGLAAAVHLARSGAQVLVLEAHAELGGGTRTAELTLPGFLHDVCSAVHPMGILSPWLRQLPLADHGLRWICPPASVAHPLDDEPAVLLQHSVADTAAELAGDARAYRRLIEPFLRDPHGLLADALAPLGLPRSPLQMLRFGLLGLGSATRLARRFETTRARALIAGCAGHAILPLDRMVTAAVALMFAITGHVEPWPVAAGGSHAITRALASLLQASGGRIETGVRVRTLADLPAARVYLFDTSPTQLASIAEPILPARYVRRLRRYQYGPGVFKLDWALDGAIPWRDPRCLEASTVHVGGPFEEVAAAEAAVWRGEHPERPFVMVCQQSQFDPARAPPGKHTGYAYCHVPAGSTVDVTAQIEQQLERFAPGFRERILARHVTTPADLERGNPNYVGGAITGGVADLLHLFKINLYRLNP
jgi:phytoene dehydrogenase-like protein